MALKILDETYEGNRRRETMPYSEARRFKEAVKKAFEQILAYPLGIELGKEINRANWHLSVLKAGKGQENNTILERQGPQDLNNACYAEVLNAKDLSTKIQQLIKSSVITLGHPAVKKFYKFYTTGEYREMMGPPRRKKESYPIAHKSQDQARKVAHTTEDRMRVWVESLASNPDEIDHAVGYVRSLQNGLIGYHIMTHLTPGTGSAAFVVWDPQVVDAGVGLDPSHRAAWMTRPSWIGLVHELIHGWRLVTGQCIFRPEPMIEEYYEEAMTVGLSPYDGCKFTENRFRMFSGQPPRTFYGPKTRVISEAAQKKHTES